MESPQRRSGIPIPKSKLALKKHMSKSSDDLLGDNYGVHNTSGDLDLFTLLEENIALKEKTENLLSQKNSRMFIDCFYRQHNPRRHRYSHLFLINMMWLRNASVSQMIRSFYVYFWHFAVIQKNVHLERENSRLSNQLREMNVQQNQMKGQLQALTTKFQKDKDDQRTKENIQVQQNKTINE